ncbi:LPXTG cell wall anchor domain-containing protein [Listeria monocytogenes]|uniref:LPXTG cell wall anchor domain-containing protein n=1 Tax=Listeria monocytogenes TaxID=1639 RepID=UPI0011EB6D91|nr:LPXTG cell wall anchor domain-containing protein [Listeria monocytogenes]TYV75316.1 LPXTG cell wall anchor domain-containing protein [Listeria monocytogenes]
MKKNLLILAMIMFCFLFGMESNINAEELIGNTEITIPVNGTLTDIKAEEQIADDENSSGNVTTIIKDKSIQKLPTTGEKLSLLMSIIGVILLLMIVLAKIKKLLLVNGTEPLK